ncbi:MAG: MscL family protein [bacterium]|nr:MscL family protein [bacterium]
MGLFQEFKEFLKQYGVIGLAIAVVMGGAVTKFVGALVSDLIMPIIAVIIPSGDWQNFVIGYGNLQIKIGHLFGACIDLLIIALIVFLFAKYVLKEEKVTKK